MRPPLCLPSFLILATVLPLLAGCGNSAPEARQELPPQAVTVAEVAKRSMAGGMTASGRLLAFEEIAVAPDLNGYRVTQVMVEEDSVVRRGQVLATLDDSLLRSQIDQARAALAQQEIAAEQARDQAARVHGLDGQGVLSGEAIDNRRIAVRSTQAVVAATRAQLNDLLVRQSHLVIRAPTDGIVLERTVRPGDTSAAGTAMFRLARNGLIEHYAELAERDIARIKVGDPAEVTLASGRKLAGKVRLIGARVSDQTGLVIARIALPRSPDLRQGGFAQARFVQEGADVLAVPEAAVDFDASGASVQIVGRDDRVKRIPVRTGRRAQGLVELVAGPPAGSRVVVKGGAFTLEGDKVRIAGGNAR